MIHVIKFSAKLSNQLRFHKLIISFALSSYCSVFLVSESKYVLLVAKSIHGYRNDIVEKGNRYVLRV